MLKLIDPDRVAMECEVNNKNTGETWKFKNFLTVGFKEQGGKTILIAADLRDFARGIEELAKLCKTSLQTASPEVRKQVETDLIIEAVWGEQDEDN